VIADIAVIGKGKAFTAEDAEDPEEWERRADPAAEGGCRSTIQDWDAVRKFFRSWDGEEGGPR